ncbi:methyl-accepting chemotaxis protein [Anaerospora hongkongensis]|uniref:Methyl-accepting chemotaxis protein n=2 Tax=Anaerospora hongkongensis TaxID=244830 RepID=A0A4R1Q299_9FIRM|nr:methyl-accepting chemotaxis protein [Anaerospora hongkongensis]TCL39339.1 methyl-accepting chemotaxis protein [Anaerospora hongkongensis]
MSIKTKMVALLVISLLVVGMIIAGSGMYVLYQQTMNSTQITMVNQAVQLSGQVSDLFESFDKSGKVYGQDSELQSADPARIQAKIDTYFGVSWGVDRLNFLDQTGKRLAIAPYDTKVIGDSLADRTFFKDTLRDQKSHVSDIIVNRVTGVPSVIVTQPVKDQGGKLTGMVLQAVNLETLQNYLGQVKVGATGVAAIISQDGTLIAHTNRNLVKEQKKIADDLMNRLKGQPGRLVHYTDLAGRDSVALVTTVNNTNWLVITSLPTSEFTAGFYASLVWMLAALAAGLILVGLIGWRYLLKTLQPIEVLVQEAAKVAQGDLSLTTLKITSKDEVGRLAQSFEQMASNLRGLMRQVTAATEQVAASAEQLHAGAEQSAQAANQVAVSISSTSEGIEKQTIGVANVLALVENITQGSQEGAEAAVQAAKITKEAVASTVAGSNAVDNAIVQMNQIQRTVESSAEAVAELGNRSKEIGVIVDTISGIAAQTNLLALNAAIEAARAGEQGRGFAVVAEEVRKLAEQSQIAAKQISELIRDIQDRTDQAVVAMTAGTAEVQKGNAVVDQAGASFTEIQHQIEEVAAITQKIAQGLTQAVEASKQVLGATQEVDEIGRDIAGQAQNISAATEEQSASMEEIAASSQSLANIAAELQKAVRKFTI